jgi:acyl-CoA synthetase (AMP-forming)/AMP-acid ligase II
MTVRDVLVKAARRFPHHEAVVFEDTRLTTKELLERVFRISNALLGLGLKKGDRVAVLLSNCHQSVECFYGIQAAGLVLVPMNARNSAQEHRFILDHSDSRATLMGGEFVDMLTSIRPQLPNLSHVICVTGRLDESMLDYEELMAAADPGEPQVAIGDDDLADLRYTSGTTGRPKGAVHTHRANLAGFHNVLIDGLDIQEGDAVALSGPVTHASGSMVLPHVYRGAKVIVLSGFDPNTILEVIQRERVTTLYLVPTMIVMILANPDLHQYDLSSIKTIRYGASPIAPEILKQAIDVFGDVFVQGYGLTEAGMPMTLLLKDDHILDGTQAKIDRLRSVGREVTLSRVGIVDDEDKILPAGEIGEIVVRCDQVMTEYWKNPEATATALRGGWLHTRDLGYMDEDGYLFLVDRKDDMIISGGFNIYPREVEDVLYMHEAVLEAAVFGIPDQKWGEAVKAVVSLKKGRQSTEEELIEHCKAHLASYKKPKSVEFIDVLPKNATGKILRRSLKEPYWEGKTRKVN